MNTRGITLLDDVLILSPGRAAPDAFWARLKHRIQLAGLVDAYRADFAKARTRMLDDKSSAWASPLDVEFQHEAELFQAWALRVVGPQQRWPWEPGWTEADVDAYLTQPAARAA